jgi:hypothetical protein
MTYRKAIETAQRIDDLAESLVGNIPAALRISGINQPEFEEIIYNAIILKVQAMAADAARRKGGSHG